MFRFFFDALDKVYKKGYQVETEDHLYRLSARLIKKEGN